MNKALIQSVLPDVNGKYYAFDGQHTIEARKRLNGNKDCDIVCKVFFGMTPEEEARLFAAQTGTSSKPSAGSSSVLK